MTTQSLAEELALFEEERPRLVTEHDGQFVLIKGRRIFGIYPSREDALSAGYEEFGMAAFLVRKIAAYDAPVFFLHMGEAMTIDDPVLIELAEELRELRSQQPSVTSERAFAQQTRSLMGMMRPPSSGDSYERARKQEA